VLVERCFALERATWGEGTCATRQCFSREAIYFRDSLIAGGFRQQRRNVIAASGTSLNNADAAFGGLAKGPALFAVPITERAPGSISKILCGYFQDGSAGSSGVILSLSSPDLEAISGARMINVSLEKVVVQISADPVTGKDVCVSSAVDGARLFSIPSDVFSQAMLSVDAELGYRLASNSNLRRLSGGVSEAAFSIKIVSSSAPFLEPSSIGLLAIVLLAPGIFAFKQGSAFGTWRGPDQVSHRLPAAQPENIWERPSAKMGIVLER
jgi:hypothetical protein